VSQPVSARTTSRQDAQRNHHARALLQRTRETQAHAQGAPLQAAARNGPGNARTLRVPSRARQGSTLPQASFPRLGVRQHSLREDALRHASFPRLGIRQPSIRDALIQLPDLEGGTTPFDLKLEGGGYSEKTPVKNDNVFEIDVFMSE
jgi:hypothetical protein